MARAASSSVSKATQFVKDLFKKDEVPTGPVILTKQESEPAKTLSLTDRESNKDKKASAIYHRADTNVGEMNKFILQFSRVEQAYRAIEDAFLSIVRSETQRNLRDKMKRKCEVKYIRPILKHLGYPEFTNTELKQIFNKDVTSSDNITFKRLLVGSGLCYYEKQGHKNGALFSNSSSSSNLSENNDETKTNDNNNNNDNDNNTNLTQNNNSSQNNTESNNNNDNNNDSKEDEKTNESNNNAKDENAARRRRYRDIAMGFDVVKKMFDKIDDDRSGEITHSEFKQAFMDICRDPEIVDARMAELDYNKDQEITFREFIFGIASWVGFNDNDEYEDADEFIEISPPQSKAKSGLQGDEEINKDEPTTTETEDASFMNVEKTFEVSADNSADRNIDNSNSNNNNDNNNETQNDTDTQVDNQNENDKPTQNGNANYVE